MRERERDTLNRLPGKIITDHLQPFEETRACVGRGDHDGVSV